MPNTRQTRDSTCMQHAGNRLENSKRDNDWRNIDVSDAKISPAQLVHDRRTHRQREDETVERGADQSLVKTTATLAMIRYHL